MLDAVENAVVTDVSGLNLKLGATTLTVVKRKGVKFHPPTDSAYQITIAAAEQPDVDEYLAFGQNDFRYRIEVTFVTPNQEEWLANLDTYIGWRESVRALYKPPTLTTTNLWRTQGVWDVRVKPNKFLERAAMPQQYDVQALTIEVGVHQ